MENRFHYQLCNNCAAYMFDHPTLPTWYKCISCGYCKLKLKREKDLITLEMYLMGRDKTYPNDITQEIRDNATVLLEKINALLKDLGVTDIKVSSGWRPPSINAALANSAKKSLHMIGKACDISDKDHTLSDAILKQPDLLKKYNLWIEDPTATPTWCHLDFGIRTDRPLRMFKV